MSCLRIIIVNWNAGRLLHDCLLSIISSEFSGFEIEKIVVVDNASSDNSILFLTDFDLPVEIIQNTDNRGFAAACNQGASGFDGEYLLFLNPDTRLYSNSLHASISFMQKPKNHSVGICGIQLIDEKGSVSRSCARFPTALTFFMHATGLNKLPWLSRFSLNMEDWDHTCTQQVDHVIGAYFLIRRPLFEKLNGFDESFFVYLEDLDLSKRLAGLNYRSFYLAQAQAFHFGGGSSRQVKARRLFFSLRSRLIYAFKHFSAFEAYSVLAMTLLVEPCSRLALCLLRRNRFQGMKETLSAYVWLYKSMPDVLRLASRR